MYPPYVLSTILKPESSKRRPRLIKKNIDVHPKTTSKNRVQGLGFGGVGFVWGPSGPTRGPPGPPPRGLSFWAYGFNFIELPAGVVQNCQQKNVYPGPRESIIIFSFHPLFENPCLQCFCSSDLLCNSALAVLCPLRSHGLSLRFG